MSRGLNKQTIFRNDLDCLAFLRELQSCIARFEWKCLAYVLMVNHFHLLILTPKANLGQGMRDLKGEYAKGFNARHGGRGPIYDDRYKSQLVQDGDYLLSVARYIALNPVRAGLVKRPEDYRWSSYRHLHAGEPTRLIDAKELLSRISLDLVQARREFIDLVADGAGLPVVKRRAPIIGSKQFVRAHAPNEPPEQPVARATWNQARPPLSALVDRLPQDEAMRAARLTYRYTLREIAAALGCSTETVRRRLRMWDVRT